MEAAEKTFGVAVMVSFAAFAACGSVKARPPALSSQSDLTWRSRLDLGSHPTARRSTPTPTAAPRPTPGSGSPRTTPRLIAPLSTSISMSMSPMFTWQGESASHGRDRRRLPGSGLPEHHRLVRGNGIVGAAAAAAPGGRRLLAGVERHDRRADLGGLGSRRSPPRESGRARELELGPLQRRRIRGSRGGRPGDPARRRPTRCASSRADRRASHRRRRRRSPGSLFSAPGGGLGQQSRRRRLPQSRGLEQHRSSAWTSCKPPAP